MAYYKVLYSMRSSKLSLAIIIVFTLQNHYHLAQASSNWFIKVNLWNNSISISNNGEIIKEFNISAGQKDTPTPVGYYKIINKSKDWGGGFGTRWLGINVPWGTYGIHGTNRPYLIGQNVSHGCLRMKNKDVEWVYDHIPVGTPVTILGPIHGIEENIVLAVGSKGTLVYLVQQRLKVAGYYNGDVNGIFDKETERAINCYQRKHHLKITGHGNRRLYLELGLLE